MDNIREFVALPNSSPKDVQPNAPIIKEKIMLQHHTSLDISVLPSHVRVAFLDYYNFLKEKYAPPQMRPDHARGLTVFWKNQ